MIRADKIFGHRLIMTPVASYVGMAGILYGVFALATGAASFWWLIPMMFSTFWVLMGITVGFHRLFTHRAFKTGSFWKLILLYLGTVGIYGSSIQWGAMHASHHMYSDTTYDPHYTGWRYLFWKKNNYTRFHKKTLLRLYRDPMHRFFHNYYALIVFLTAGIMSLISLNMLVFCYLIPLGWLHFVGSAHQVFAHDSKGPLDQPLMEFALFTGGEWCHKWHHDHQKDPWFGSADVGYHVIRMIKS